MDQNKKLILKESPNLKDLQNYVKKLEKIRGFDDETILGKCLMLGEKVGELFKAVRKQTGIKVDQNSKFKDIDDELADILIFILAIANRLDINLEEAFRQKEIKNKQRNWEQDSKKRSSSYSRGS